MKTKYIIPLFALILVVSMSSVLADSCTPDSGYNSCSEWSKVKTYNGARAEAYVQVQGNSDFGQQSNGYYLNDVSVNVKFKGDKFYVYDARGITNWDSFWSRANCGENGCSNYEKKITANYEYELAQIGESFDGCPVFVAWDYDCDGDCGNDDAPEPWAWAYTTGAWGWLDDNGDNKCLNVKVAACTQDSHCAVNQYCDKTGEWNSWSCKAKECENGQERCNALNVEQCENYKWVDKGKELNKCNVECLTANDCSSKSGIVGDNFCQDGNVVQTYRDYNQCSGEQIYTIHAFGDSNDTTQTTNLCQFVANTTIVELCEFGCTNAACNPEPEVPIVNETDTNETEDEIPINTIHTFEDCEAAGNPVMESHPRKCTANNITFVEDIGPIEDPEPKETPTSTYILIGFISLIVLLVIVILIVILVKGD